MNKSYFKEEHLKEFNDEEGHLSLLNWIWRYKKKFKQFHFEHQIKVYLFENFFSIVTINLKFCNNIYIHIENILYLEVNI